jgi:Type II restriction endonuclease, TdeIII
MDKTGETKPYFEQMITAVLKARRSDDLTPKTVRADLCIFAHDGTEYLFEIKAPKPNKGQCLEVIQRLLIFHLLRGAKRPQLQAYYAMPYNPYGVTKAVYKWSQARNYLPFYEAVVIGDEFWNIVGGPTAYEELLEIYLEVGRERSKYMMDALAFGF